MSMLTPLACYYIDEPEQLVQILSATRGQGRRGCIKILITVRAVPRAIVRSRRLIRATLSVVLTENAITDHHAAEIYQRHSSQHPGRRRVLASDKP